TEEAQITNSTSVMMTTVAGDEYAIGYVSLGSLDDSVKAVKIDGAEATAENIKSGDYTVSRPFNIATKEDMDNAAAKDFINFILSEEGQTVVSENGYIALDDVEAFESTMAEGKVVVGGSSSVSPVMEKLIEAYKKINANAEIELQTTDSTTGMTSTIDGSYDIGMASRDLKEEEIAEGLIGQVIATDGIAVIVNLENPTDDMTVDQVNAIYVGNAYTWDEVIG
ncbi:MAG: substrate-binding domain-containing protein, partial [Dorea sp.]